MSQMVDVLVGRIRPGDFLGDWAQAPLWSRERDRSTALSLPRVLPVISVLLAVVASIVSATQGWMTAYNDAASHLDIARRITDSLTPGFGQLGSVWLPLPHLLMAPLVAVDWLWHTGVAGAIVMGAAFVYATVRIFSLTEEWTGSRVAAWCAYAIFATNVNLLYLQSAALDETLMLACVVGAVYHLARWTRNLSTQDLLLTGFALFLGTLTRYDGWALFIAVIVAVAIWSRVHDRRAASTQANLLTVLFIGGYGIALWVLYNAVILHNPLYFLQGQTTELQRELAGCAGCATKGSVTGSIVTYGWTILDVIGLPLLAAAALGAVLMLVRRGAPLYRNLLLLGVLATPIVLNVFTLFVGETTIDVPQLAPFTAFNTRFGIEALPFAAVAAGSLASYAGPRLRGIRWAVLAVAIAAALSLTLALRPPINLTEGVSGASGYGRAQAQVVGAYLGQHYTGGRVLVDDSQVQSVLFNSGLPLRDYITLASPAYYQAALHDPAANAGWVLTNKNDRVAQQMTEYPDRYAGFRQVFSDGSYTLYQNVAAGGSG
ncbi:MAG: glycosyltransferase family 39 protein [Candidatus Dormibacteraeota bacterium]|nr:glycosyltransferase family 39 protein [Candidatus Dormibacteraeota bacterium]